MQSVRGHRAGGLGCQQRHSRPAMMPICQVQQPGAACVAAMPSSVHPQRQCCSTSGRSVMAGSGRLGDVSLFGSSVPAFQDEAAQGPKGQMKVADVPLESEVGMDYILLRDELAKGEFRAADDETRSLLIRLAGDLAVKRGWVYFSEVKDISVKDFQTMDNLWKAASNGKFGFSVQREIFIQNQRRWPKFFKQIDWVQGVNNVYRKWPLEFTYTTDAARGHLPLTNALRGTQLFEAIMNHPAWEKKVAAGGAKKTLDESIKGANANTLKF